MVVMVVLNTLTVLPRTYFYGSSILGHKTSIVAAVMDAIHHAEMYISTLIRNVFISTDSIAVIFDARNALLLFAISSLSAFCIFFYPFLGRRPMAQRRINHGL